MGIGERVRALRQARKLSQSELARRSGVGRTWIIHLEAGRVKQPSLDRAVALARGLGVPVEALADEETFRRVLDGLQRPEG